MFSKAIETRNAPSGSDVLFVSFHACARGVSKIACSSSRARTSSSKFRFSQLFGQISRRTMRVFEALRFFVIRSCKKKNTTFGSPGFRLYTVSLDRLPVVWKARWPFFLGPYCTFTVPLKHQLEIAFIFHRYSDSCFSSIMMPLPVYSV